MINVQRIQTAELILRQEFNLDFERFPKKYNKRQKYDKRK